MAQSLNSEFQIGSIVTLKSHYTRGEKDYLDNISIAGDDKSISPYMLVTEILKETKNKFDEHTGENTIQKDSFRVKVLWFNAKSYEFNEKWISSSFLNTVKSEIRLKKIKPEKLFNLERYIPNEWERKYNFINNLKPKSFKRSSQVILKTNPLEIKKKRISIKEEEWNTKISKSSLLSFCAPEMVVIGKSTFKPKDPLFDKVTNERIREIPTDQIKVQFYNPLADKYSEEILPIECFEIADVKSSNLDKLINANQDDQKLVSFNDQLFSVKNISYLHGIYMIQTKNFVDETVESFMLHEIVNLKELKINDVIGGLLAPFWTDNNHTSVNHFFAEKAVANAEGDKHNIREFINNKIFYIHYKNLKGKFTKRFIKVLGVSDFKMTDEDEITTGLMVHAFCYLRKEERTFTFTDDRLLAIYDVKIELDSKNKVNIEKLLSDIKEKAEKNS